MTSPEAVVRDYYDALRSGEALAPYFRERGSTVKFGIGEALYGYADVADALESQTETTTDWTVESHRLAVAEHGAVATVADEVTMAWTDTGSATDHRFETRWSGTLVRAGSHDGDAESLEEGGDAPDWLFQSMHVSAPHEL